MIIQHRGKQIIRRAYRVKIAREMQVYIFHRDDLRVSAPGGAAFDSEYGTQRRLPQGRHRVFAQFAQSVRQADCRRRLALSGGRGIDRRDKNQFPVRAAVFFQKPVINFRFIIPV